MRDYIHSKGEIQEQTVHKPSLRLVYLNEEGAEGRAAEYDQAAKKLMEQHAYDEARLYAEKAVVLMSENKLYKRHLADICLQQGDIAAAKCDLLESSHYYREALLWYKQADDPFAVGKVYYKLGKANPVYYVNTPGIG